MRTLSSELGRLSRGFNNVSGAVENLKSLDFKEVLGGILGGAGAILTAKITTFAVDGVKAIADLGLATQQISSQFAAMTGSAEKGTAAYEAFNDVSRNTNYDQTAVMNMGKELMNIGYSAQNAADLISLCANTAAGLGQDISGAQQLVDIVSKIQSTGKLSTHDIEALAQAGLDMEQVFSNMGMTAAEAMAGFKKGTIDSRAAIEALEQYMGTFDGKMAESQNNIIDQWNGITGNLQECCAQIGKFISDAFMKTDILSGLIDLTQAFIDLIRGEGCGVFKVLGDVIKWSLGLVSPIVKVIVDGIKVLMLVVNELGEAFNTVCAAIYDKLSWILDPLMQVYDTLAGIFSSLGKEIDTEINKSFKETFSTNLTDSSSAEGTYQQDTGNNFRTSLSSMVAEEMEAAENLSTAYNNVANAQTTMLNNGAQLAAQSKTTINWAGELTNAFGKMGSDILKNGINFMDGLKNAFRNFAESVINQLMNIALKAIMVNALTGLFGGGSSIISGEQFGLGKVPKVPSFGFADGGFVSGEGTSTSDSIPAMLSNGEYVLNAAAVRNVGRPQLDAINAGARHYVSGGYVGGAAGTFGGRAVTFNVSALDTSGFADYLAKGGLDAIKQALFEEERGFSSAVGVW
ncbi:MAG: tape measure protein [Acidaminococcaceae bacterium]|nr:tape measure protein [Acidaminococcaceae bacterium]